MEHVIKKKKKRGSWPKLAIRHGQMARLNEVLYPLKKPDMFVTFCYVAKKGEQFFTWDWPGIRLFCNFVREATKSKNGNVPICLSAFFPTENL
jgi:hypothetical protein